MTAGHMVEVAALLLIITLAGALLQSGRNARMDRLAARRRAVRDRKTRAGRVRTGRSRTGVAQFVGVFGIRVVQSGLLSDRTLKGLRATLANAGLRPNAALGLFVGSKLLLLVGLPLLAWAAASYGGLSPLTRNLSAVGAGMAGLMLPDFVIKQMRSRHRKRVEAGIPDALDMLIICTEAGMAIEQAIFRVSQELRFAHSATADELAQTSTELQMTADPQVAFFNMGDRTSLESLARLGVTVVQTINYGSPLSQALRTLAVELRGEMIIRYEESAARLPVMLTIPMIIFILPALFLVIAGPAAIRLLELQTP